MLKRIDVPGLELWHRSVCNPANDNGGVISRAFIRTGCLWALRAGSKYGFLPEDEGQAMLLTGPPVHSYNCQAVHVGAAADSS